jgi:uncharacterized protein (TIRG00374 family)
MRKQLLIGVGISLLCLYFVFRGLSIRDVGQAMRHADVRWLAAAMSVYACGFMMRAIRWEVLMKPIKPIPAVDLLRPMVIGFFANNVLPFRMGELVRAHVTGQKFSISRTASLATIVVERIFDTISFLTIFLAVALFFPFPGAVRHAALVLGIGCAGLIIALLIASTHEHLAHRVIDRLPLRASWKEKARGLLKNFTQGVSGMTQASFVIKAVTLSMVVWFIEGTTVYLITRAFPINLSYPQAYFLLFFLGLSVTLPQAPGYVGTVELFGVTALSLLGVPREMGLPVILAIHGCQFAFIAMLGVFALWKEGVTLGSLLKPATK